MMLFIFCPYATVMFVDFPGTLRIHYWHSADMRSTLLTHPVMLEMQQSQFLL